MWKPKIKAYTKDTNIQFPCACEIKFDGEWIYWNGFNLMNKRKVPKVSITKLPDQELYGELYYGEGKEFYSEIHSHNGYKNEVMLYDTGDYGLKPYIQRRTKLELLAKQGHRIVPMEICNTREQVFSFFSTTINNGYEGIVAKPLDSLTDSSWVKMKREYTAKLKIKGLRKDKTIPTATMGTDEHIYCSVSLNGWGIITEMLGKEKTRKGVENWIIGEDKENYLLNSDIVLELKHNGIIGGEKLRHPRVKRVCEPNTKLDIQKGNNNE